MAQPKYQLLQQWLRDQINSGEYTANQQIPTELELAEQFGYSRQTIRQAISGLEQEGLLKRTPGRGTFVCRQNAGRVNRSEIPHPQSRCADHVSGRLYFPPASLTASSGC